ncbi:MAG TPA: PIN domain-containing protein [Anaerolineae bacterium]|nr:PIN domain-containing protein [Anaerolineae bacterium]
MKPALLDTDIFSEILKAKNPVVLAHVTNYRAAFGRLTISAITVMEIVQGLQHMNRREAVQKFLDGLNGSQVLGFDRKCAETAGRIYGDLLRTGQPIGRADPMIAATAIQNGLVLVTGNTAHYERISKLGYILELENWREE